MVPEDQQVAFELNKKLEAKVDFLRKDCASKFFKGQDGPPLKKVMVVENLAESYGGAGLFLGIPRFRTRCYAIATAGPSTGVGERESQVWGTGNAETLTCLSEFLARLWLGRLQGELFFSLHMRGTHTIQPIFFSAW